MDSFIPVSTGRIANSRNSLTESLSPRPTHSSVSAIVRREMQSRGVCAGDERVEMLLAFIGMEEQESALREVQADWTECRCKLHQRVECGAVGATGCAGKQHGEHAALRGLYEAGHRGCVVQPGVRARDKQCFEVAEFGWLRRGTKLTKFKAGFGTAPARMGAYYCYTNYFPDQFVVRAARILGPRPLKVRVVRYALLFGKEAVAGHRLEVLPDGDLHVSVDGSREISLLDALVELCSTGERHAAVGTDPSGSSVVGAGGNGDLREMVQMAFQRAEHEAVSGFVEARVGLAPVITLPRGFELRVAASARLPALVIFMKRCGVDLETDAALRSALLLATTAAANLPLEVAGVKDRMRLWALHGDAVMKSEITGLALVVDAEMSKAVEAFGEFTNDKLARAYTQSDLDVCCDASGLVVGSKACADIVEAVVGVVALYAGRGAAMRLMKKLGILVEFHAREAVALAKPGAVAGLTAKQKEMALRMAALGLLD